MLKTMNFIPMHSTKVQVSFFVCLCYHRYLCTAVQVTCQSSSKLLHLSTELLWFSHDLAAQLLPLKYTSSSSLGQPVSCCHGSRHDASKSETTVMKVTCSPWITCGWKSTQSIQMCCGATLPFLHACTKLGYIIALPKSSFAKSSHHISNWTAKNHTVLSVCNLLWRPS